MGGFVLRAPHWVWNAPDPTSQVCLLVSLQTQMCCSLLLPKELLFIFLFLFHLQRDSFFLEKKLEEQLGTPFPPPHTNVPEQSPSRIPTPSMFLVSFLFVS